MINRNLIPKKSDIVKTIKAGITGSIFKIESKIKDTEYFLEAECFYLPDNLCPTRFKLRLTDGEFYEDIYFLKTEVDYMLNVTFEFFKNEELFTKPFGYVPYKQTIFGKDICAKTKK